MSPAVITALCTGGVALLGAVTALVKVLTHQSDPAAHDGQGHR